MGNVGSFTPRSARRLSPHRASSRTIREGYRAQLKNIWQASHNFQVNPHTPGSKAYREWKKEAKNFRKTELAKMKREDNNYKRHYEIIKNDYTPKTRRKLRPSRSSKTSWSSKSTRSSRTPKRQWSYRRKPRSTRSLRTPKQQWSYRRKPQRKITRRRKPRYSYY